jgi:hypothetical protein
MPLDLNQLHLCGQGYIVIQDLQMLKRDYLEEKTMNYTLEPSEALRVFTKYWNVALKSLHQGGDFWNQNDSFLNLNDRKSKRPNH